MRTFDLGGYRRARVWIGELPDATCAAIKTLKQTFPAGCTSHNGSRLAAIEVFVPLGSRWMYGMLGGQFLPDAAARLSVEVSVSAADERYFADSLAMNGDEVRVGLPAEYSQAVFEGVNSARTELAELSAGKLRVYCAAHGAIGSCEVIYKNLAAILIKVLTSPDSELSDHELGKLFPLTFK